MSGMTNQAIASSSLRQRLLSRTGFKSYGPMIMSDSHVIAEILALIGYDHIIIDHEHGPTSLQSCQRLIQSIELQQQQQSTNQYQTTSVRPTSTAMTNIAKRTEPIVRLPGPNDPVYMKKVLDSMRLPAGVLVPLIDCAETAKAVVQATRFPHNKSNNSHGGIRGCAIPFVRSNHYGLRDSIEEYMRQCEEDLLVLVQVETLDAIQRIPEIADVDGIDGIFLGPLDISASIGKAGQFHDEQVQELISTAEELIRSSNNCLLTGFQPPHRDLRTMFHKDQYSLVCGSVDIALIRDAAIQDLQKGRDAMR